MPQPSFWLDKPSKTLRAIRLVWVLGTTAIIVRVLLAFDLGRPLSFAPQSRGLYLCLLLLAAIPITGSILEVFRSRSAKWINTGFWILLAAYYLAGAVFEWSNPFGPLVLIIGIALLIPAGINYLLYRSRDS